MSRRNPGPGWAVGMLLLLCLSALLVSLVVVSLGQRGASVLPEPTPAVTTTADLQCFTRERGYYAC